MSTPVVVNGVTYQIPDFGERGWSEDVSSLLISLANNTLFIDGATQGLHPLIAEADFGNNAGIVVKYIKSKAANPSSTGFARLGNSEALAWRNAANSADLLLNLATDVLQFNNIALVDVSTAQTLTNKNLASATNVVSGATATDFTNGGTVTLPSGTRTLVARDTTDTLTNKSIDADTNTISNLETDNLKAGVLNTSTSLAGATNAQVPSALAVSTLVATTAAGGATKADKATTLTAGAGLSGGGDLSANRTFDINVDDSTIEISADALRVKDAGITDAKLASGIDATKIAAGTVTNTEFGYLGGVTSDVQAQIDDKVVKNAAITAATKTKITYDAKGLVTAGADLVTTDLPDNIPATKLADGTVTDTELQYINTLTSNAQDQLDARVVGPGSSVNNRLATFSGTTGKVVQESTVTADSSGNLIVPGNLTVNGTTTSINSTNLDVVDKQITVNKGGVSPSAEGAGIAVESDASVVSTIAYDSTKQSKWTADGAELVNVSSQQTLSSKTLDFLKTEVDSTTISANSISAVKGLERITGGGTTLDSITSSAAGKQVSVYNASGLDITVTNSGNIVTGTGSNFTLKNGAAASFVYDGVVAKWLLVGGSGGGGLATSLKTTAFTAAAGNHYLVSTASGGYTATLPAGSTGAVVRFSDDTREWSTKNLTIAPASGESIDGLAANESLVCDVSGAFVQLMWNGTKWVIDTNGYAAAITSGSLSSAQGMGAKNYVSNPNNATNWAASAGGITVTTESTLANLPANSTQSSGIKVLRASGSDYARTRFVLDAADYGKKFRISFDQKYAGTSGDYTVSVYSFTANDYTTGATALTAQTSSIAGLTGSFETTVDMPGSTAPYIELRINGINGTSSPLYLNNVYVGPGVVVQGAAVGSYESTTSYTIGQTGGSVGSGATYYRRTTRDGEYAIIRWEYNQSNAGTAGSSGQYTLPMPSGLTIDTTKIRQASASGVVGDLGSGYLQAATTYYTARVIYNTTTAVAFDLFNDTGSANSWGNSIGSLASNPLRFSVEARIPIAEWSGSGTVNLGPGAQVEYVSSSFSAWSADRSSAGTALPTTTPAGASESVTSSSIWQYPQQSDDRVWIEVQMGGTGPWMALPNDEISDLYYDATGYVGLGVQYSGGSYRIIRGKYRAGTSATWSSMTSGNRYRLVKAKASSPVGFGLAGNGTSGLISSEYNSAEGDLGTVTIAGGTWTTIDSKKYKWARNGKHVTLWYRLESTTAASLLTDLYFSLPSDCPTPATFSTGGTNEYNFAGVGSTSIATGGAVVGATTVMYYNGSAYIVYIAHASTSSKIEVGSITYPTA